MAEPFEKRNTAPVTTIVMRALTILKSNSMFLSVTKCRDSVMPIGLDERQTGKSRFICQTIMDRHVTKQTGNLKKHPQYHLGSEFASSGGLSQDCTCVPHLPGCLFEMPCTPRTQCPVAIGCVPVVGIHEATGPCFFLGQFCSWSQS